MIKVVIDQGGLILLISITMTMIVVSDFIEWQSGKQPDSVWFALKARPIFFWNLSVIIIVIINIIIIITIISF